MSDMLEMLKKLTAEVETLEKANTVFAQEVAAVEKAAARQMPTVRWSMPRAVTTGGITSICTKMSWTSTGRRLLTTSSMPTAERPSMAVNPPISITSKRQSRCAPMAEATP